METEPDLSPEHEQPSSSVRKLRDLLPGMVGCSFCGSSKFRRSRFRRDDIRELLLLRYPVRCTRCGQRQYLSFGVAGMALPPKHHGPRLSEGNETWRAWTELGRKSRSTRPMSTAAEPRARNIERPLEPQRVRDNGDGPHW